MLRDFPLAGKLTSVSLKQPSRSRGAFFVRHSVPNKATRPELCHVIGVARDGGLGDRKGAFAGGSSGGETSSHLGTKTIWVVGDIFMDVQTNVQSLPAAWGTDTLAESIEVLPGGSAANTARHLHSLLKDIDDHCENGGVVLNFVASLGDDHMGKAFLSKLDGEGLGQAFIQVFANTNTSTCIVLSGPEDRSFISSGSSTKLLRLEDTEGRRQQSVVRRMVEQIRGELEDEENVGEHHILLHGFFNMLGLHDVQLVHALQDLKQTAVSNQKRLTLSLGPQFDGTGKWTGEGEILRSLLPLCDLLLLNTDELDCIRAANESQICLPDSERSTCDGVSVPSSLGPGHVIETRGVHGSKIYLRDHPRSTASFSEVTVELAEGCGLIPADELVDATGAGDSFIAGFFYHFVTSKHDGKTGFDYCAPQSFAPEFLTECCVSGHRVAAWCVQQHGACRFPVTRKNLC